MPEPALISKDFPPPRIIGSLQGKAPGPSIIFTAGIHGNEPSGVIALQQALHHLTEQKVSLRGKVYALAGNRWALREGERYHRRDLNRIWTRENIARLKEGEKWPGDEESREQAELYRCLQEIIAGDSGPFYFIDLHSTSSETIPFIIFNDSLLNRRFAALFPLPMILGLEEYIEGPLLSYINELGYLALGFEAGQHHDPATVDQQFAFIMLVLILSGVVNKSDLPFQHYHSMMARHAVDSQHFYEILYRYRISSGEQFRMVDGFVNLQNIRKGQLLAHSNGKAVTAPRAGKIFMPLYQSQGEEGFFLIRQIPRRALALSKIFRRWRLQRLLSWLPGVSWHDREHEQLVINRKIARFFTKKFFHLLGYRSYRLDRNHLLMSSREDCSRESDYQNEPWWQD